jgi:hypothetical protein
MIIDTNKLKKAIRDHYADLAEKTEKRYPKNDRAACAAWTRQETAQIQQENIINKIEALARIYKTENKTVLCDGIFVDGD